MTPALEAIIKKLKTNLDYWSQYGEMKVQKKDLRALIDYIEKTKEGQNQ